MSEPTYETYRPPVRREPEQPIAVPQERLERRPARRCGPVDRGALETFLVPSTICVAIWLMTGAGYFWPMWVMLGTGIPLLVGLLERLPRRG
jgi:hypothetical protein